MADSEDRSLSDEQATPSAWPIVWITAAISFVASLPVIMPYAIFAGIIGAVAAAVVGVPAVVLAFRLKLFRAWHAVTLGALAAALSPVLAAVLMSLLNQSQGAHVHASGGYWRMAAGVFQGAGVTLAPFGAAAAFTYWARYVAPDSWPGRHRIVTLLVVVGLTSSVFATGVRWRQRTAGERGAAYAAEMKRTASPDRAISVRLVRVADAAPSVVRLVSYAEPSCALVLDSKELADHVVVGADVWVDVREPGPASAAVSFRITKVGDITDPVLLASAQISGCRPWH